MTGCQIETCQIPSVYHTAIYDTILTANALQWFARNLCSVFVVNYEVKWVLIKREVVIIAILVEVAIHPGQLLLVLLVRGMPSSRVLPTFPSLSHSLGLYGVQDCHRVSGILGCFYLEQRILLIGHSELDNSCFLLYSLFGESCGCVYPRKEQYDKWYTNSGRWTQINEES